MRRILRSLPAAMFSSETSSLVIPLLVVFAVVAYVRFSRARKLSLPDGPKPTWFIGNVLQIQSSHPEETFTEWGAVYASPQSSSAAFKPLKNYLSAGVLYIPIARVSCY
ncbi:hypothetical protein EV421DRAFT_1432083 [Armillaria borealis]|uniref:Cytochrome P450 n=1 Tax=Armillaria borealis TaxID=47425 RepID=A0AA39IZP9_9AGAR|nr:hypothetical protein EV421DRAFT_1432083 [Armillaria borealis]